MTQALLLALLLPAGTGALPSTAAAVRWAPVCNIRAAVPSTRTADCRRSLIAVRMADQAELTSERIAEMLEATFVRACMDAARGVVDTKKLFVVAAKAGYELALPIPTLRNELAACQRQTAGRALMPEESELRDLWLSLVYLTLRELGHAAEEGLAAADSVPEETRVTYALFVNNIVAAQGAGAALSELKIDAMLPSAAAADAPRTALQTAILSQSMRVVYLTKTVIDEEERAGPQPKPFIPGA